MKSNINRKSIKIIRFVMITIAIIVIIFGGIIVSSSALAASKPAGTKVYASVRVEEGDSLWSIASRYCDDGSSIDDYIDELKNMNDIVNDRSLKAGAYLMIYYYR